MNTYDKNGIPILPGDTLKVFHFVGPRRQKFFMYKFVKSVHPSGKALEVLHLSLDGGSYWLRLDGRIHPDYEIVQGYEGVERGGWFKDRKKGGVVQ
jgi:hypothetical protein